MEDEYSREYEYFETEHLSVLQTTDLMMEPIAGPPSLEWAPWITDLQADPIEEEYAGEYAHSETEHSLLSTELIMEESQPSSAPASEWALALEWFSNLEVGPIEEAGPIGEAGPIEDEYSPPNSPLSLSNLPIPESTPSSLHVGRSLRVSPEETEIDRPGIDPNMYSLTSESAPTNLHVGRSLRRVSPEEIEIDRLGIDPNMSQYLNDWSTYPICILKRSKTESVGPDTDRTIFLPDYDVSLKIPAGAVTKNVDITISTVSPFDAQLPNVDNFEVIAPIISLEPDNLQLLKPATLTVGHSAVCLVRRCLQLWTKSSQAGK